MSVKSKPFDLSSDNLIYVLNRCHKSLMRAYAFHRQISEEFLFVANLAKETETLVKQEIEKQKINNNENGGKE